MSDKNPKQTEQHPRRRRGRPKRQAQPPEQPRPVEDPDRITEYIIDMIFFTNQQELYQSLVKFQNKDELEMLGVNTIKA